MMSVTKVIDIGTLLKIQYKLILMGFEDLRVLFEKGQISRKLKKPLDKII